MDLINSPRKYILSAEKASNAPLYRVEPTEILQIIGNSPFKNAVYRVLKRLQTQLRNSKSASEANQHLRAIRDFLFVHQISNIVPNLPLSTGRIVQM